MARTPGPTGQPVTVRISAALCTHVATGPELSPYRAVREKERETRKKATLVKTRLVHCLLADEASKDKVTTDINIYRNLTIDRQRSA